MNKNLSILALSQVFGFTANIITVFLSGIVGSQITSIKSLSTLPTSLSVLGTAIFTIVAAKIMDHYFWEKKQPLRMEINVQDPTIFYQQKEQGNIPEVYMLENL